MADFDDGDQATAQVMQNAFLEIGLDQIVGEHKAYINVTPSFILGKWYQALPKDQVVLEILETIQPDPDILDALSELSKAGYTIALDDFVYEKSLRPFLAIANIIKIDVLALPPETVQDYVRMFRQYPVKLLAEKVETHEDFEACKALGFDLFQGYFFCKPQVVSGKSMQTNRMSMLILLAKLQDANIEMSELEDIIKSDISLSLKILRYVNSPYFGLMEKVDSIGRAACLVGIDRLRMWATLLTLVSMKEKPHELILTAIVRGKMCEFLGVALQQDAESSFFTVGLFSLLDTMFDGNMADIVSTLPLSSEVCEALLAREGVMGEALNCVLAYERGEWESVWCRDLDQSKIQEAYLQAIQWSSTIMGQFKE